MLPDGWSAAQFEDYHRAPWSDENKQNHVAVDNPPYYADVYDGPYTKEVRVWRGAEAFGGADESVIINCENLLYVCFVAILRNPEAFL